MDIIHASFDRLQRAVCDARIAYMGQSCCNFNVFHILTSKILL